jgi:hypothetical protein
VPSAKWPIPYMPGDHFLEKSAPRGVPGVICTTQIVARWGCGGGEAGPFLRMTVVSILPYSHECVEGPFLGQLEIPPTPGLEVGGLGQGECRRKAREEVAVVLAIGHALRAHQALSCPDALPGFLEVFHRLFENGVFVGHDQSIRAGILRSVDCFAFSREHADWALSRGRTKGLGFSFDNRENPYMFRNAMLKLLLAETLPYKKLIEDAEPQRR